MKIGGIINEDGRVSILKRLFYEFKSILEITKPIRHVKSLQEMIRPSYFS